MSKKQEQISVAPIEADAKAAHQANPEYDPAYAFSSDAPIERHEDDKLNRTHFAHRIAETLIKRPAEESIVVGIYGKWGSGKSSVLNMMQEKIKDNDVIIVNFNPWYFSSTEALIQGFFAELNAKLHSKIPGISESISIFSNVLAPLSFKLALPIVGGPELNFDGARVKEAIDGLSNTSLEEEKNNIEKALVTAEKRIIVFVDDIDRLDKDETHTLFKIVKLFANFPYMAYVLAFDDEVVAQALGDRYGNDTDSGRRFLEKIVQVPLHLPITTAINMDKILKDGIQAILNDNNVILNEHEENWLDYYQNDGKLFHIVDTMRDCNKFLNSFMFLLPLAKNGVNIADFIAIELIRVKYPEVYTYIYNRLISTKIRLNNYSKHHFQHSSIELNLAPYGVCDKIFSIMFPEQTKNTNNLSQMKNRIESTKSIASYTYFESYFLYIIDQETQKRVDPQPQPTTQE